MYSVHEEYLFMLHIMANALWLNKWFYNLILKLSIICYSITNKIKFAVITYPDYPGIIHLNINEVLLLCSVE